MKRVKGLKYINILVVSLLCFFVSNCDTVDTEFGNNAKLSGVVKGQDGDIVAGDITFPNLVVHALGEGAAVSTDIRVKGDGTYRNTKLFPKKYKIWIEGPVKVAGKDTVKIDFSIQRVHEYNFVVTPFIDIEKPVLVGKPSSSSIKIKYQMTANNDRTIAKREIYVSTVSYPNPQTGSGPFYHSKTVNLGSNKGTVTIDIDNFSDKNKYFIRVGALASGANNMNFSQQVVVTSP